ncbi:MAG: aldo/keto reductase, partial [Chloroflexota bacterium]
TLKQQGKVRFIGVTGFPVALLKTMAEKHELDVTLSYCHGNLLNNRMHNVLVPTVQEKEMGLLNASVTHMGLLTRQGGQTWHPASDEIKVAARQAAEYCASVDVSLAELAIQFAVAQLNVDVTVLGARTIKELDRSIAVIEEPIAEELLTAVQARLKPAHNKSWPSGHEMYWE